MILSKLVNIQLGYDNQLGLYLYIPCNNLKMWPSDATYENIYLPDLISDAYTLPLQGNETCSWDGSIKYRYTFQTVSYYIY